MLTVSIHSGISDSELDEKELGKRVNRSTDITLYKKAVKGDLVFNMMRAWQGAVGSAKSTGLVSPAYIVASPNEQIDPTFMDYYVHTRAVINRFNRLSYGALDFRKRLYWDSFVTIEVNIPVIEEQQKIADFLSSVDDVIAASEEEVANLETQKKAVMKKIFSQEVRFKRDDGSDFPEWEKAKLRDVCIDFIVPMRDKPKEFDGDIPWCRIEDIEEKYFTTSHSGQFVSEKIIKDMNLKIHPVGTVICSCSASLGTYAIATQPLITNQTFIGLVCSDLIYNEYLLYYMMTQTEQLKKEAGGTTILYVSRDKFEEHRVMIPCLEEQHLIADFLSSFDEAIAAAKKELALWKELKKGLLQQMFV